MKIQKLTEIEITRNTKTNKYLYSLDTIRDKIFMTEPEIDNNDIYVGFLTTDISGHNAIGFEFRKSDNQITIHTRYCNKYRKPHFHINNITDCQYIISMVDTRINKYLQGK